MPEVVTVQTIEGVGGASVELREQGWDLFQITTIVKPDGTIAH
jgi:hypothetical protein